MSQKSCVIVSMCASGLKTVPMERYAVLTDEQELRS